MNAKTEITGRFAGKFQEWLQFFTDARSEFRKVVWPSREEAVQSTWVVALMVLLMSMVLWGLDSVLLYLMSWITGQGA